MQQGYKYLFLLMFIAGTLVSVAQDEIPPTDTSTVLINTLIDTSIISGPPPILSKANNLLNTKLSFTVPNPISNNAFNKSFIGVYQVNGSMNMALYKGVFIGVTFSNAFLKISKTIIPNMTIATSQPSMNVYTAAINVGGDFYLGDKNRIILSTAVSVGQCFVKYSSFAAKVPTETIQVTDFKSLYGAIDVNMIFLVEPNWGIGPTISYSLIKRAFDPRELCLQDWASYGTNNSGATQYFSFGVVCYYSFFKK